MLVRGEDQPAPSTPPSGHNYVEDITTDDPTVVEVVTPNDGGTPYIGPNTSSNVTEEQKQEAVQEAINTQTINASGTITAEEKAIIRNDYNETKKAIAAEKALRQAEDSAILDSMGLTDAYSEHKTMKGDIFAKSTRTGKWIDIGDDRSYMDEYGSTGPLDYTIVESASGVRVADDKGISQSAVMVDGKWTPSGIDETALEPIVSERTSYNPFKMDVPVTDNYGKLLNKDAWVLDYDTPIIYEPGGGQYDLAVGPTGKKLDMWGGYDPKRGAFVVTSSGSYGPDVDTLGEVMLGRGDLRNPEMDLKYLYGESRIDEFAGRAIGGPAKKATYIDVAYQKNGGIEVVTYNKDNLTQFMADTPNLLVGMSNAAAEYEKNLIDDPNVQGNRGASGLGVGTMRSQSESQRDTLWGVTLPKLEVGGVDFSPAWSIIKPFALPGVGLSGASEDGEYLSLGELVSPALKTSFGNRGVALMEQDILDSRINNASTVVTPFGSFSKQSTKFDYQLLGFKIAEADTPQIPGTGWYYDQPKIPGTSVRVSPQWSVMFTAGTEINQHIENAVGGIQKITGKGPIAGVALGVGSFIAEAPASALQLTAGNMALESLAQNPIETAEYTMSVGSGFVAGQQTGFSDDFWRTATMDALMVGTLFTGAKSGLRKMSSKGISDPLYEGVSSRSLSDRALWTGQAAYDIYKIGPGKRKVLASDIVLGWIAERTPLRTNVQPTFNDLAYVKPEWSGAIEKTIGEYQGRVGGSTALSSELKNMPSEVKAGLEVELTRKAKDIDIRLKPGDALPFAESAVKNIKLADPTAKIWISKGENTSANVKAVINGDTVTVFDIKALEMNEGGSSGYGIGLKPYYNLAREPLTRQLYNKGELGYTGDIPSTTMSYLLQRKTLSAYVDNLFDSKKWGYRMDKDTADVIGPSMAMKAYWTSKASNPLALRSKLYSWLSDASIKNISEHKYTFFDDRMNMVRSGTGAQMYLTQYPGTMYMQRVAIAERLRNYGSKESIETGAIFDAEGHILGGIRRGNSDSIAIPTSKDMEIMSRNMRKGKAYEVMHYHPGNDNLAYTPSYTDVIEAARDEARLMHPLKESISHNKGFDVFYHAKPDENSLKVKIELMKYKYATNAALGDYGGIPQVYANLYIRFHNNRVSPGIDLDRYMNVYDEWQIYKNKKRSTNVNKNDPLIKDEPLYNLIEDSSIKTPKSQRSVFNTKTMKAAALSKISSVSKSGEASYINPPSKAYSPQGYKTNSSISPLSRVSKITSSKITSPYKSYNPYPKPSKITKPSKYDQSYYPKTSSIKMPNYLNDKYHPNNGGSRNSDTNIFKNMIRQDWINAGIFDDLSFGIGSKKRRKRRGRKR